MALKDAILPEFDHEMGTTRRVLERVPDAEFAWKPHEKSFNLGQLAGHVANIPHWVDAIVKNTVFDLADAEDSRPRIPESTTWLLSQFEKNVGAARAGIAGLTDPEFLAPWTFKNNGQVVFTSPKKENISSSINHMVHHRGQLTVYLRLNNLPVPSIYGPSADDRAF